MAESPEMAVLFSMDSFYSLPMLESEKFCVNNTKG